MRWHSRGHFDNSCPIVFFTNMSFSWWFLETHNLIPNNYPPQYARQRTQWQPLLRETQARWPPSSTGEEAAWSRGSGRSGWLRSNRKILFVEFCCARNNQWESFFSITCISKPSLVRDSGQAITPALLIRMSIWRANKEKKKWSRKIIRVYDDSFIQSCVGNINNKKDWQNQIGEIGTLVYGL